MNVGACRDEQRRRENGHGRKDDSAKVFAKLCSIHMYSPSNPDLVEFGVDTKPVRYPFSSAELSNQADCCVHSGGCSPGLCLPDGELVRDDPRPERLIARLRWLSLNQRR